MEPRFFEKGHFWSRNMKTDNQIVLNLIKLRVLMKKGNYKNSLRFCSKLRNIKLAKFLFFGVFNFPFTKTAILYAILSPPPPKKRTFEWQNLTGPNLNCLFFLHVCPPNITSGYLDRYNLFCNY